MKTYNILLVKEVQSYWRTTVEANDPKEAKKIAKKLAADNEERFCDSDTPRYRAKIALPIPV